MAVPKRRSSKARQRKRRTHYTHTLVQLIDCPSCGGEKIRPHHVCPSCGQYKGKQEIEIVEEEVEE